MHLSVMSVRNKYQVDERQIPLRILAARIPGLSILHLLSTASSQLASVACGLPPSRSVDQSASSSQFPIGPAVS